MPHLVELVGSGQPGWSGPDDGHVHSGTVSGDAGHHPALLERPLDDGVLDALDRHGRVYQSSDAGSLAGGGAHASSELREVVRLSIAGPGLAHVQIRDTYSCTLLFQEWALFCFGKRGNVFAFSTAARSRRLCNVFCVEWLGRWLFCARCEGGIRCVRLAIGGSEVFISYQVVVS